MEDKKRLITFILFMITVLLLAWILLPTFSFAKNDIVLAAPADLIKAEVEVSDGWAKPSLKGRDVGVAYITLENVSGKALALVGAETEVAARTEVHTHIHGDDGTMQMREVERLDLLPRKKQVFKPGGLHLMLFGLKQPLEAGQKFTVKLKFDDISTEEVEVTVRDNGE